LTKEGDAVKEVDAVNPDGDCVGEGEGVVDGMLRHGDEVSGDLVLRKIK